MQKDNELPETDYLETSPVKVQFEDGAIVVAEDSPIDNDDEVILDDNDDDDELLPGDDDDEALEPDA